MKIGELFVQLGVNADTPKAKEFAKTIGDIPLNVAAAVAALAGLDIGLMALTSHTLDIANGLNIFRSETGLSTQELQKWQNAAKQFGISNNAVEQSLMGITDAIVRIRRFGDARSAMAFGQLGIPNWAALSPFQILQSLRSRYGKMDPNIFRTFASQLGVSPEMTRLFAASPAAFGNAMSAGPTMSEGNLRALASFQAELARFGIVIEQSFAPVLAEATPALREVAEALRVIIPIMGRFVEKTVGGDAKFFNEIHKMGGWDAFMNGLILDSQGGDIAKKGLQDARRPDVTINNTLHAHGDDAHSAVKNAMSELDRHMVRTAHQLQGK